MKFANISVPADIEKGLEALNFNTPTEVQEKVIPIASQGKDLISCAETGSGKTAAFALPSVIKVLENPGQKVLVLSPTRELAQQTADFFRELCKFAEGIRIQSIVGGADMRKQLKGLKRKPQFLIATPGRLNDHLKRGSIKLDDFSTLVLDEGDRMLDMGFAPQIDLIIKKMPNERQSMLFTATLAPKVKALAKRYLSNPDYIQVGKVSHPVKSIRQSVIQVKIKEKENRILDELNTRGGSIIIFSKTKRKTDQLAKTLTSFGHKVDLIHGDRSQGQRNRAIKNFKSGRARILCATDIAARGIDVPHVEHVINYDLPMMHEDYVHRIGRTARNGAEGEAVSFVTPQDHRNWQSIARTYEIPGVELVGVSPVKAHEGKRFQTRPKRSRKKSNSRRPRRH